jgi:type I restriction enzyme M protein
VIPFAGDAEFQMLPRISDGQLLFLLNNVSKMKEGTDLGSRIVEVHNGSSLFTGDAGGGESNARRYLIERDLVEAIIALPENMFYNTGIGTYIWILSNRKDEKRKGKIQLIDATNFKQPLRKNLGKKNCEFSPEIRHQILEMYLNRIENGYSKLFDNSEFGYWKITVMQPKRDVNRKPIKDKQGNPVPDKELTDTEQIHFSYKGGIKAFLKNEILPFAPDAWIDDSKTQIGYELSFTKYFYKPVELRPLAEIIADIRDLEQESEGLLNEIIGR